MMDTMSKDWIAAYGSHVSSANSQILAERYSQEYLTPDQENAEFTTFSVLPTGTQPKQVSYDRKTGFAVVSCMSGRSLQVFSDTLEFEMEFDKQCVEVATHDGIAFATLSDFSKLWRDRSEVVIVDLINRKLLSRIETGGEWSKFTKICPEKQLIFVSNWKSNSVSVISYANLENPVLLQVVDCGISPRGIDYSNGGERVLVAGYYSRNIIELQDKTRQDKTRQDKTRYELNYISPPFDYPAYSGNMRDVYIDGEYAYVTNMGRNLVCQYSLDNKEIVKTWLVGKFPNAIRKFGENEFIVSCRETGNLLMLNPKTDKVVEIARNIKEPTGLDVNGDIIFSTAMGSSELLILGREKR